MPVTTPPAGRPLRILVITDHYPPHLTGGYDIACEATVEGLRRLGHEVCVLTSVHGVGRPQRTGHVHRVLHRPQDLTSLPASAWWEWRDHHALASLVASWRPEIVSVWKLLQSFPSLCRPLARLGVPVVFNLHDLWLPAYCRQSEALMAAWEMGGIKRVPKLAVRMALRRMNPDVLRKVGLGDVVLDHVVFCSRFRQEQHQRAGLGGRQSCVIYNGIEGDRFTGAPRLRSQGALKVLFVGRLVEEKGLHTVIDSIARLRESSVPIDLTVLGLPSYPFEYRTSLDARIVEAALGDCVTFRAPASSAEMPSIYREHDVLVFPSIGPEGFPMTLLEAAASGLAIVGTTTGGSGEFLADGTTGLVFAPGDAEGLAHHLATLYREPERAVRMAHAAQTLVRTNFTLDRIARQTSDYLAEIARGA